MAKNANVALPVNTWTLITASGESPTKVTFENVGTHDVIIMGTTSQTAPTAGTTAGIKYAPGFGEANKALADLFPGISAIRLYALAQRANGEVFVSHA